MERTRHLQGFLIIIFLFSLGGLYLWQNNQPSVTVSIPVSTPTLGEAPLANWQIALETQFAAISTPLLTPDLETTAFIPSTLPPTQNTNIILEPAQIQTTPSPTPDTSPTAVPPTTLGLTPFPSPTDIFIHTADEFTNFQPPPEQVPLSPHANDHFWLMRPVDASANSESIFFYPFGSNGPANAWRVHHGVDIPNPIGEPIQAGGSGTIVFAGNGGELVDTQDIDIYPAYGNVVVLEHNFGYRGKKIFTLYAHMASILVETGQLIEAGDILGLIGNTGDVSGPHVHMEVRLEENKYFSVYNPLLWIAPYIGHGVIAGQVFGLDGNFLDDITVTLSQHGRVIETTTTYIQAKTPVQNYSWNVVPDPAWQENFVLGDIAQGEYTISVTIAGKRISQDITVAAGTTNFAILDGKIATDDEP